MDGAYRQDGFCLLAHTGWKPGQAYLTTWNEGRDIRQQGEQPEQIQSHSGLLVIVSDLQPSRTGTLFLMRQ